MTLDEARERIIEGMNYPAYRETESSLYDSDKNRLFGAEHYRSDRPAYKPSPWTEGDFEKQMSTLLVWANVLNRSVAAFSEAQRLLENEESVIGSLIRRAKVQQAHEERMADTPKPHLKSATGDFYVQSQCCTSCGVPQSVAPDLVGWTSEAYPQCYWIKQPQTSDELGRAIKIIHTQELGCHRYSGTDQAILRRLPAEDCNHIRPDLKLDSRPHFASSGPSPKFTLSASAEGSLLSKLWRRLRH